MREEMQNCDSLNRLKGLFRELFQIDTADLDFGLYRLFRLKREEIDAFLDKQLPDEVKKAFASVTDAERESLKRLHLERLRKRIRLERPGVKRGPVAQLNYLYVLRILFAIRIGAKWRLGERQSPAFLAPARQQPRLIGRPGK